MASRAAADAENDILTFLRNDLIAVDRSITLSTSADGRWVVRQEFGTDMVVIGRGCSFAEAWQNRQPEGPTDPIP
jgi:hypothetical protein